MAAVCLAVIGGVIGLALGLQDRDDDQGQGGDQGGTAIHQEPPASPSTSEERCQPEIAEEAVRHGAQGTLTEVLYVQTTGSEVWICRDSQDRLYYQGHRGIPADRPIEPEGENWLFLTDVWRAPGGYQAVNKNHVYRVNTQQLTIVYPDGREETELAVS